MALTPLVLTDARIYYESADLTGYSNKVELATSYDDLDYTTFASGGYKQRVAGLIDVTGSLDGFWQAGDLGQPDDAFWTNLGSNIVALTVVPTSGAVGQLAYLTRILESDYKPGGQVGALLGWSATAKGDWPLVRGQIMHPQGTARTTTGTGTGYQLGALSATQAMYACLHVLSIAGTATPTITVKLQSSPDNTFTSPVDRIVFAADTALDGQALRLAGAVTDTWWRASWTISGTTPSFMFAVSAGIATK